MFSIQKKIAETVKNSTENPHAAVAKLMGIKKEAAGFATETSPEFYNIAAMIYEAVGDIWMKAKKPEEAIKRLQPFV